MGTRIFLPILGLGLLSACANTTATPTLIPTVAPTQSLASTVTPVPTLTPTVAPAAVSTVAAGILGAGPVELLWTLSPFSPADGIGLDPQGNLYVMDSDNHRIERFDREGQFITMWGGAGKGEGQWECLGVCMLAVDGAGQVFISDVNNARVQKFDSNGKFLAQWGSFGSGDGQFNGLFGVGVDREGNVYVGDVGNFRIQKFDNNGRFLLKWGGFGYREGQFTSDLADIVVDTYGNIYVSDRTNGVQKFDSLGNYLGLLTACGDDEAGYSAAGLAIDSQGNIYSSDIRSNRICKYDADGRYLNQWNTPSAIGGLAVDQDSNVYAAERFGGRVLKLRQR